MENKYLNSEHVEDPFVVTDVIRYLVILDYIVLLLFLIPIGYESYNDILHILEYPNPTQLIVLQFKTLSHFSGGFFPELLYTIIVGSIVPRAIYLTTKSSTNNAVGRKSRLFSILLAIFLITHFIIDQTGNRSSSEDRISFSLIIFPLLLYSIFSRTEEV